MDSFDQNNRQICDILILLYSAHELKCHVQRRGPENLECRNKRVSPAVAPQQTLLTGLNVATGACSKEVRDG